MRERTQGVWDSFYSMGSIWKRSRCVSSLRGAIGVRLCFQAISADVRQHRNFDRQRAEKSSGNSWARWLAVPCRKLFLGRPMPDLQVPIGKTIPGTVGAQTGAFNVIR